MQLRYGTVSYYGIVLYCLLCPKTLNPKPSYCIAYEYGTMSTAYPLPVLRRVPVRLYSTRTRTVYSYSSASNIRALRVSIVRLAAGGRPDKGPAWRQRLAGSAWPSITSLLGLAPGGTAPKTAPLHLAPPARLGMPWHVIAMALAILVSMDGALDDGV